MGLAPERRQLRRVLLRTGGTLDPAPPPLTPAQGASEKATPTLRPGPRPPRGDPGPAAAERATARAPLSIRGDSRAGQDLDVGPEDGPAEVVGLALAVPPVEQA